MTSGDIKPDGVDHAFGVNNGRKRRLRAPRRKRKTRNVSNRSEHYESAGYEINDTVRHKGICESQFSRCADLLAVFETVVEDGIWLLAMRRTSSNVARCLQNRRWVYKEQK